MLPLEWLELCLLRLDYHILGLGVTPPVPTWGNLINAATDPYNLQYRFWLWVIPGIFLFLTVLSINLIGEGLRDAFDPKEQG